MQNFDIMQGFQRCPISFGTDMPTIRLKENEPFDVALRRFKRACEKAGVLAELRRREFYEKPTQERNRKKAAPVNRQPKHKKDGGGTGTPRGS